MKAFRCGDVVPGCTTELEGEDEEALMEAVAAHARGGHGVELDAAALAAVRARVRDR